MLLQLTLLLYYVVEFMLNYIVEIGFFELLLTNNVI